MSPAVRFTKWILGSLLMGCLREKLGNRRLEALCFCSLTDITPSGPIVISKCTKTPVEGEANIGAGLARFLPIQSQEYEKNDPHSEGDGRHKIVGYKIADLFRLIHPLQIQWSLIHHLNHIRGDLRTNKRKVAMCDPNMEHLQLLPNAGYNKV